MMRHSKSTQANWRDAHHAAAQRLSEDIRAHASKYQIPQDLVQKISIRYNGNGFAIDAPRDFMHFEYGALAPETPPTGAIRTWKMRRGHLADQYLGEEADRRNLMDW